MMKMESVVQDDVVVLSVNYLMLGKCILCPTDTCYGLIADAFNENSVNEVIRLKNRKEASPFYLAVSKLSQVEDYVDVPQLAKSIFSNFKERAITIILKAKKQLSKNLMSEDNCVGIRIPPHPLIKSIIEKFNSPIIATSANLSGLPNPYSISEVRNQWGEKRFSEISFVVDGGMLPQNLSSTIISLKKPTPEILREGDVTEKEFIQYLERL